MLRNSKPLIRQLNEKQAIELNKMGFYVYYFGNHEKINVNTKYFEKSYECCGGVFELDININERHITNGEELGNSVLISTPYDKWWGSEWSLQEFSNSMEEFQKEIKEDLKGLRKLGIIS